MTRREPDEAFSAAARARLVEAVECQRRTPRTERAPRATRVRLRSGIAPVEVIGSLLVLAVAAAVLVAVLPSAGRSSNAAAPASTLAACADSRSAGADAAECGTFVSTAGHDSSGPLPWLADDQLVLRFSRSVQGVQAEVVLPCHTFDDVAVRLERGSLSVDVGSGRSLHFACLDGSADAEAHARAFLEGPSELQEDAQGFTVDRTGTTVRFERVAAVRPHVVTAELDGDWFQVGVGGQLDLDSHGCLALGSEVLVLPSGSSISADGVVQVAATAFSKHRTYRIGDHVEATYVGHAPISSADRARCGAAAGDGDVLGP